MAHPNIDISAPSTAGYTPPLNPPNPLTLPARPGPLRLDPSTTALVIVDMQNAYLTKGGYIDTAGLLLPDSDAQSAQTTAQTARALEAARAAGLTVLYFQNGFDPQTYADAGAARASPNWYKSNALRTMRDRPETLGKLLARGTWDHDIVEGVRPREGDLVVGKTRYSGFFNTGADSLLRARGVRNLVFCGVASNVCVESSIRDAFHLEYFCVMLEDACHGVGGPGMHEGAVLNVERFFGWVASVDEFCGVLKG